MGRVNPAGAQALRLGEAASGLLGMSLRDQQIAAHVGEQDVVLRVKRPAPKTYNARPYPAPSRLPGTPGCGAAPARDG